MQQCTALTRFGARCRLPAQANDRCRWHGGLVPPALLAQPPQNLNTGKWSNAVPTHLLVRYSFSAMDPQYRSLRSELALLDARIEDLLGSLGTGNSPDSWKKLTQIHGRVVESIENHNPDEQARAFTELELIIAHGNADTTIWANIQALIEQRRRLIDSENRGDSLRRVYVQPEEAAAYTELLLQIVRHHIPDPATCEAINTEFTQVLGLPSPPAASE